MKDKTISNIVRYLFLIVFMFYLIVFIMVKLGYYEYASYKKRTFTEEQIMKFEEDIKNNKEIDIDEYLVSEEDFQDRPKRFGLKLSEFLSENCKKGINGIFKFIDRSLKE